jgi:hypothetical protein
MRLTPSRRRGRAVALLGVALLVLTGAPARADVQPRPAAATPGSRLIRIGPQALISVDDQGRVTMADEPPPASRDTHLLGGMFALFGAPVAWILVQGRGQLGLDINSGTLAPAPPAPTGN